MQITVALAVSVLAITALAEDLAKPADLALVLNEDEFEDYLDTWLEQEEAKWIQTQISQRGRVQPKSDCTIKVNGDLGQPQPVYLRNNNYWAAVGGIGQMYLNTGEQVLLACIGAKQKIKNKGTATSVAIANATCVNNALVSGSGWLNGNAEFGQLTCNSLCTRESQITSEKCYKNNVFHRVGYTVDRVFYPLYHSCFDVERLEVLYVRFDQTSENIVHQNKVDRPDWLATGFPNIGVDDLYTVKQQKLTIAKYVGAALTDKYITKSQFLARGHLAAKSDYVFATGQHATFFFINAAPQWQPFNGGNWNSLEQNLRARIGEAGYNTVIYSGTFGITQLRNQENRLVDIYLYNSDKNGEKIPVPLYYYKVVYDSAKQLGTAFVGINNPYYTEAEVKSLTFCTDQCRGNRAFKWLEWQPNRIDLGYSFCCTVDDFRKTVPYLPAITVKGLLS